MLSFNLMYMSPVTRETASSQKGPCEFPGHVEYVGEAQSFPGSTFAKLRRLIAGVSIVLTLFNVFLELVLSNNRQ